MKKIFLLLTFALISVTTNSLATESNLPASLNRATAIYEHCEKTASPVLTTQVLQGNIEDVKRERSIRLCLKKEIINIASTFIAKDEITTLSETLNNIETNSKELYRILIFCPQDNDTFWCKENYNKDTSLEKLILEKNITSEIYHILEAVLTAQNN